MKIVSTCSRGLWVTATSFLAFSLLAACSDTANTSDEEGSGAAASCSTDAELDAAAKKEGRLSLYSVDDEAANERLTTAFEEQCGIQVETYRATAADVMQRYSAERESGRVEADVLWVADPFFFEDTDDRDWFIEFSDDVVPGYGSDSIPADLKQDASVTYSILPISVAYNTDLVSEDELPSSWEDITSSEGGDRILMLDPRTSLNYLGVLDVVREEVGEDVLRDIGATDPRLIEGSVSAVQALAAGEGAYLVTTADTFIQAVKAEGAPVDRLSLSPATGTEIRMGISTDAANPNAARLFASWVLSEEGQNLASDESHVSAAEVGSGGIDYVPIDFVRTQENEDEILELLGIN